MAQVSLAQVRAQYPDYNDLSDQDLADALHAKFYSDMDPAEFYGKVGLENDFTQALAAQGGDRGAPTVGASPQAPLLDLEAAQARDTGVARPSDPERDAAILRDYYAQYPDAAPGARIAGDEALAGGVTFDPRIGSIGAYIAGAPDAPAAAPAAIVPNPYEGLDRSMVDRLMENLSDSFGRSGAGNMERMSDPSQDGFKLTDLIAGENPNQVYQGGLIDRLLDATLGQERGFLPGRSREEIGGAAAAEEDARRDRYDARAKADPVRNVGDFLASAVGQIGPQLVMPENWIGIPGAGIGTNMAVDGASNALLDAVLQSSDIQTGVQDRYSLTQTAMAAGTGAAISGTLNGTMRGVDLVRERVPGWEPRRAKTVDPEADPEGFEAAIMQDVADAAAADPELDALLRANRAGPYSAPAEDLASADLRGPSRADAQAADGTGRSEAQRAAVLRDVLAQRRAREGATAALPETVGAASREGLTPEIAAQLELAKEGPNASPDTRSQIEAALLGDLDPSRIVAPTRQPLPETIPVGARGADAGDPALDAATRANTLKIENRPGPAPRPMQPEEIAQAQRAQAAGRANPIVDDGRMTAPEGRSPQTRDDIQTEREAGQAFDLAQRQRDRLPDATRDTQTAGVPRGPEPIDVLLNDGFPVRVVGITGQGAQTRYRVERYDPRTGQADPEAVPYEVLPADLQQRSYQPEPRRAQDFGQRDSDPRTTPEQPRMAGQPVRREETKTYQATPTDSPEGGNPLPGANGPDARPPLPEQDGGPSPFRDQPSGERRQRAANEEELRQRYERAQQEDAYRSNYERQQEAPKGKGERSTNTEAEPDADGRYPINEAGFVRSNRGGPIIFDDQKMAARWILKVGQAKSPDQIFELANHPGVKGKFTVLERGRAEGPNPGGDTPGGGARPETANAPEGGDPVATPAGALPDPSDPVVSRADAPEGGQASAPRQEAEAPAADYEQGRIDNMREALRTGKMKNGLEVDAETRADFEAQIARYDAKNAPEAARPADDYDPNSAGIPDPAESVIAHKGGDMDASVPDFVDMSVGGKADDLMANLRTARTADEAREVADAWVKMKGAKTRREHLVALDQNGALLMVGSGTKTKVAFPAYAVGAIEDGRVSYLTHNHPRNTSLSLPDLGILTLAGDANMTIRAVGGLGSVSTARPGPKMREKLASGEPRKDVLAGLKRVNDVVVNALRNEAVRKLGWNLANVEEAHPQITLEVLSRAGVIDADPNPHVFAYDIDGFIKENEDALLRGLRAAGYDVDSLGAARGNPGPGPARAGGQPNGPPGADAGQRSAQRPGGEAVARGSGPATPDANGRIAAEAVVADARTKAASPTAARRLAGEQLDQLILDATARGDTSLSYVWKQPTASGRTATFVIKADPKQMEAFKRRVMGSTAATPKSPGMTRAVNPNRFEESTGLGVEETRGLLKASPSARAAWDAAATGIKQLADNAKSGPVEAIVRTGRQVVLTNAAAMNLIAAKYPKVPALRKIADLVAHDPGTGRPIGQTYQRAVEMRTGGMANELLDILGVKPDTKLEAEVQMILANTRRAGFASPRAQVMAKKLRSLLDKQLDYMKAAGVEVGYVRGGYFPRVLDEGKIAADPTGFKAKAEAAYRAAGMDAKEARDAASAWYQRIFQVQTGAYEHGVPTANSAKGRVLPKSADVILKDFYQTDVRGTLLEYMRLTSRAAENVRSFGKNDEKLGALFLEAERAGVTGADLADMRSHIDSSTGRFRSDVPSTGVMEFMQTAGVLALLGRATISSLAEGLSVGVRSHNVANGLEAMADGWREMFGLGRDDDLKAAAKMLGVVGDAVNDLIVSASFGGAVGGKGQQQLLSKFFKANGLHQVTQGQRTAAFRIGDRFLRQLLDEVTTANHPRRRSAERLLSELGIPPAEAAKLKGWLGNRLPLSELTGPSREAALYRTATQRFVDDSIQNPSAADRPMWSNHPFGRAAFGVMSFMFSFTRNVLNRTAHTTMEAFSKEDYTLADRARFAAPAAALAILVAAQTTISEQRDKLLSRSTYDQRTKTQQAVTNLSRAGLFGTFDPLVNVVASAKYERDLSSSFTGAYLTFFLDSTSAMTLGLVPNEGPLGVGQNSDKTENAEHKATKSAYQAILAPLLNAGISTASNALPGGVVGTAGKAAAMAGIGYGSSNSAATSFADRFYQRSNVKGAKKPADAAEADGFEGEDKDGDGFIDE